MTILVISTTGNVPSVLIEDLGGLVLTHPVVDLPLTKPEGPFELTEVQNSLDFGNLGTQITGGNVEVTDALGNVIEPGDSITSFVAADSINFDLGILNLVGDVDSPGNSFYYGTNSSGVKGWHTLSLASGETNTASNLGAGIGVFDGKVGVDLQFRSLVSQNSILGISLDGVNSEIDFTINQANIDHDALNNFVPNKHIDHASVVLTAGAGLTGGGDITTSRTFNVVGVNSILAAADSIALVNDVVSPGNLFFYGTNGSGTRNWLSQTSINHNTLTNYVADQHVAHSSVILTAGAGLSGGGDITTSRTFNVNVQNSIDIVSDTLQLENDVLAPGNLYFYSTDETGTKGWYEATQIFSNDFIFKRTYFGLDGFVNVAGAGGDWVVNKTATAGFDSIAGSIPIRAFDDSQTQGVGLFLRVPDGGQNIKFQLTHRAQSAPGSPANVELVLYTRDLADNAALPTWTGPTDVSTISLPTNNFWQYDLVSFSLTTLNLTAGEFVQIEFVRDTSDPNDTLSGDWVLAQITILIT